MVYCCWKREGGHEGATKGTARERERERPVWAGTGGELPTLEGVGRYWRGTANERQSGWGLVENSEGETVQIRLGFGTAKQRQTGTAS